MTEFSKADAKKCPECGTKLIPMNEFDSTDKSKKEAEEQEAKEWDECKRKGEIRFIACFSKIDLSKYRCPKCFEQYWVRI